MIPQPPPEYLYLSRIKRQAAGLPDEKTGRPVSDHDRVHAQALLVSRAVRSRGGVSLYLVVAGLMMDALWDASVEEALGGMVEAAKDAQYSAIMVAIASGNLIVREPLGFLPCNGIAEIQSLTAPDDDNRRLLTLSRFAAKVTDAQDWLTAAGVAIPPWLFATGDVSKDAAPARWSDRLPDSCGAKCRNQADAIQEAIEAAGYDPLLLQDGEKSAIKERCEEKHPKLFNKPTSFENAWSELNAAGLTRFYNYDACNGNPKGDSKPL